MSSDLKSLLRDLLPASELDRVVRSYDVVGDIAVIIIPPGLKAQEPLIGQTILANNKRINVVAMRDGVHGGDFRTLPLKIIAGENRKETIHKEYGIRLLVNPEVAYFSVRSATERFRIASCVGPRERVLVMFSGIGPYPLMISKHSSAARIVGIEKNHQAHEYALANLTLNKKLANIRFICGDAADTPAFVDYQFDRIVMPLPKGGQPFLEAALQMLRPGGVLHYYSMQRKDEFAKALHEVARECHRIGRSVDHLGTVTCGHCAPYTFRICVDLRVD